MNKYPSKIVCLTEETIETLYLLGVQDLIAGITAYAVRPPEAKKSKPVVSHYTDAKIDAILALKPDLVLVWSDLQAEIAASLIKKGIEVYAFNHRNIEGIFRMIYRVGSLVGKENKAEQLVEKFQQNISNARAVAEKLPCKPKVYFEEWFDPLISGIGWVSEIIEICGGIDVFRENRGHQDAKSRIIPDFNEPIRRNPDIILASWCGKPFNYDRMAKREGWNDITAIKKGDIHEIDAAIILQPGPAALTDGLEIVSKIISDWSERH